MEKKTINIAVMLPDGAIRRIDITQRESTIEIYMGSTSLKSQLDIIEIVELLLTQDISIESIKTSVEKTLTIP